MCCQKLATNIIIITDSQVPPNAVSSSRTMEPEKLEKVFHVLGLRLVIADSHHRQRRHLGGTCPPRPLPLLHLVVGDQQLKASFTKNTLKKNSISFKR